MADRHAELLSKMVLAITPAPTRQDTDPAALQTLYVDLPFRFPLVYEKLVLSYRWQEEAELGPFELLANPPGDPSLAGLGKSIRYDRYLTEALLPAALVPFARPAGGSWDPICFNGAVRSGKHDREVVRVDHESILSFNRLRVDAVLAPSFRSLMEATVAAR